MFERFTKETRQLVMRAVDEAAAMHHARAGTGHILMAMFADTNGPTATVLRDEVPSLEDVRRALREVSGPSASGFDDLDADALKRLGVDLDEIRDTAEGTFGPGSLDRSAPRRSATRLSDAARQATFLSFKEAKRLRQRRLDSRHLLLALLDQPGPTAAHLILDKLGVDRSRLRAEVLASL